MYIYSAVTQRWHGEEFAHAELNLATRRVPLGGPLVENFKNLRTLIAPQNLYRTSVPRIMANRLGEQVQQT